MSHEHAQPGHMHSGGNLEAAFLLNVKCWIRELLAPDVFEHITVDIELEGDRCVTDVKPPDVISSGHRQEYASDKGQRQDDH